MTEPAEIKERMEQQNKVALEGIKQAYQMINKTVRDFINSKTSAGIGENEALQMAHSALAHEMANMMAYGYAQKYIPSLQMAVNNTAVTLAESVVDILKAHQEKDKKIILPEGGQDAL